MMSRTFTERNVLLLEIFSFGGDVVLIPNPNVQKKVTVNVDVHEHCIDRVSFIRQGSRVSITTHGTNVHGLSITVEVGSDVVPIVENVQGNVVIETSIGDVIVKGNQIY